VSYVEVCVLKCYICEYL